MPQKYDSVHLRKCFNLAFVKHALFRSETLLSGKNGPVVRHFWGQKGTLCKAKCQNFNPSVRKNSLELTLSGGTPIVYQVWGEPPPPLAATVTRWVSGWGTVLFRDNTASD